MLNGVGAESSPSLLHGVGVGSPPGWGALPSCCMVGGESSFPAVCCGGREPSRHFPFWESG